MNFGLKVVLLCALLHVALGGTWSVVQQFTGTSCAAANLVAVIGTSLGACVASNCTCVTTPSNFCAQTLCQTAAPTAPTGGVTYITYSAANCPAGSEVLFYGFATTQACVPLLGGSTSQSLTCSGGGAQYSVWASSSTCAGQPTTSTNFGGGCQSGNGASIFTSCAGGVCFHESTEITYAEKKVKLDQLHRNEVPECRVPHVVQATGVVITAKCDREQRVLRLTNEHLVYTGRGLKAAKDVTELDQVFADMDEKKPCRVVSVQSEKSPQKYFGLNCISSDVLAQGIKASTFGKLHNVPSFWMSTVGRVFGIDAASRWGDNLNRLAEKFGF